MTRTDEFGYALDRTKQQKFAYRHGYFWLPCAICGFERGGHESKGEPSVTIKGGDPRIFHMVCRRHQNARTEFVYVPAHVEPLTPEGTHQ